MKGLDDLVKQAQQMQEKMQRLQEEAANAEVVGESGAGMVQVTMTGRHDVSKIRIDPQLMGGDQELLEDLVAAAINDAVRKIERKTQEKMSQLTSGITMPPGFKMPF